MGRRANHGRNAAAANRSALLGAARARFASDGFDASLSAIARQAGVGQGSLYRHFPDRISLAAAVFDENVTALEALAARTDTTLHDLLALLTEQTMASVAFIDMLNAADDEDPRMRVIVDRVADVLARTLDASRGTADVTAHAAVRDTVTVGQLMLCVQMVAALLAKTSEPARQVVAGRAWAALRPSIFR